MSAGAGVALASSATVGSGEAMGEGALVCRGGGGNERR
jgi:hypothetical protein